MYIIIMMIFTYSIWDFGHPRFLKSQFGHPVMKILAKSLILLLHNRHGTTFMVNPSNAEATYVIA